MLMIPIESTNHAEDVLIVVLDDTNIERMAVSDPAEIDLRQCGKTLVNPKVLICHQNSTPEFTRMIQSRDLKAIIRYLQRGFEFRPEKGDNDDGPQRLSGLN